MKRKPLRRVNNTPKSAPTGAYKTPATEAIARAAAYTQEQILEAAKPEIMELVKIITQPENPLSLEEQTLALATVAKIKADTKRSAMLGYFGIYQMYNIAPVTMPGEAPAPVQVAEEPTEDNSVREESTANKDIPFYTEEDQEKLRTKNDTEVFAGPTTGLAEEDDADEEAEAAVELAEVRTELKKEREDKQ